MNARRYPRTLDQAFGPYNRSSQCEIVPMANPRTRSCDWALYAVAVLALIVIWRFA